MGLTSYLAEEEEPFDRGRTFGARHAARIAGTVQAYRQLFAARADLAEPATRAVGEEIGQACAAWWPEGLSELEGIAVGTGEGLPDLLAVNGRHEILAAFAGPARSVPECSVVGAESSPDDGSDVLLAQNWDYHPSLADAVMAIEVATEAGRMLTVTEAGILAKIGVNDRRLACCVNALASSGDHDGIGVPIHFVLRRVLQEASNLTDALEILSGARLSAAFCVTLAYSDDDGSAIAAVELAPGISRTVWPDERGVIAHTNHFRHPDLTGQDAGLPHWPGSAIRLRTLEKGLRALRGRPRAADLTRLLRSHYNWPDSVCSHRAHDPVEATDYATLASVSVDLAVPSIRVAAGAPCRTPYEAVGFSAGR